MPKSNKIKVKKVKKPREKESSSVFFQKLRPKFLDWQPPTQEEHAQAAKDRQRAREAESERVIALAKSRQVERGANRKSEQAEPAKKKSR